MCVLRFTPTDREAPMPATFVEEVSIAHLFKDVISATQTTFFMAPFVACLKSRLRCRTIIIQRSVTSEACCEVGHDGHVLKCIGKKMHSKG